VQIQLSAVAESQATGRLVPESKPKTHPRVQVVLQAVLAPASAISSSSLPAGTLSPPSVRVRSPAVRVAPPVVATRPVPAVTVVPAATAPAVTGAVEADQVSLFQPHLVVIYIIKT